MNDRSNCGTPGGEGGQLVKPIAEKGLRLLSQLGSMHDFRDRTDSPPAFSVQARNGLVPTGVAFRAVRLHRWT
jgi:hypothetical protein